MSNQQKFKVGDRVTGLAGAHQYTWTNDKAIMRVCYIHPDGQITVRILEHKDYPGEVGHEYDVMPEFFRFLETCEACGQTMPPRSTLIGQHVVEFRGDGIKVGCQYVAKDTVLQIADRLAGKA